MVDALLQIAPESLASDISEQLAGFGLNLFALLDAGKIDDSAIPSETSVVALVGNHGRQLWDCLPANWQQQKHPIDDFSEATVSRVLTATIGNSGWTMLFPDRSSLAVPALQDLGRAAGWHNPSPLGNGIHPEHGLWFAYRSVVAIDFEIASLGASSALPAEGFGDDSPCISCIEQPCIKSCPPSALSVGNAPDLMACVNFRSSDQSPCAEQCLARQQCPIGVQSRYADEQIRYFYRQSLPSLQRWVAEASLEK